MTFVPRGRHALLWLALGAGALAAEPGAPPPAPAAAAAPGDEGDEVEYFEQLDSELARIGSSLTDQVVSSTKIQQRAARAPAVITVITADEIQSRGYSSVAEALRSVPGLYDAYDLVSHNIGVRGINGGARASGNILKLMIDGHPVDFRIGTTNFFGEELIPLSAIDRIEVIRGPASALYGAGAFLGVVNVITRTGKSVSGVEVRAQGSAIRESQLGAGGQVMQGASSGGVDFLIAAGIWGQARSGLTLPMSSPLINRPNPPAPLLEPTRGDVARPRSVFARTVASVGPGELTFLTSVQYLNAAAEFQDVAPLTHRSRVSLVNQTYRLSYNVPVGKEITLRAAAAYSRAGPGVDERLDVGRQDFEVIRVAQTDGLFLSGEGQYAAPNWSATAGLDAALDNHLLEAYDQRLLQDELALDGSVLRVAGTIIPGLGRGERRQFRDFGAYAQLIYDWTPSLSTTLGTRVDVQNVYGLNWSNRVGFVFAPPDQALTVKLLYGSSFKPPSAEQLYTQPMVTGDLKGNPTLRAQTAHTFELAGGYGLERGRGEVLLNLFATDVLGRVEFLQRALYLLAQNIDDEWVLGGELTGTYAVTRDLRLTGSLSLARTVLRRSSVEIVDARTVTNPLYPPLQLHLAGEYALPVKGLSLSAELSYVSARAASQVNANLNGRAYELPGYPFTALALSFTRQLIPGKDTNASLRAYNLLDWRWADSGFGGFEIPQQGRTVQLILSQRL